LTPRGGCCGQLGRRHNQGRSRRVSRGHGRDAVVLGR
jgi:hypothetical protein